MRGLGTRPTTNGTGLTARPHTERLETMGILNDIDNAAWDLEHGRVSGFYPVARKL